LSKDPIGEKGGVNVYAMVGNDAVGAWDYLGKDYPGEYHDSERFDHSSPHFGQPPFSPPQEPTPKPPLGTYAGFEAGMIIGAGYAIVECCDNGCKKRMKFFKFCVGAMAGAGFFAGVHNLGSSSNGPSCDKKNYTGWFFESSIGPVGVDVGYTNSGAFSGVVEGGLNASVGLDFLGSAKWCYYIFDSEESLDECCE
jgi:hypothetical protein